MAIADKIAALRARHRELDATVTRFQAEYVDTLTLDTLKRKKLGVKDEITRLEKRLARERTLSQHLAGNPASYGEAALSA